MDKYKVNNIFNEDGITLNDLINKYFISFLDEELNFFSFDGIMDLDIS